MKIIRYTLESDGTIPTEVINGGYFPKYNGNQSPQDWDFIGYSDTYTGLEEYTTKTDFENYIKSFCSDTYYSDTNETITIQNTIDDFWSKK